MNSKIIGLIVAIIALTSGIVGVIAYQVTTNHNDQPTITPQPSETDPSLQSLKVGYKLLSTEQVNNQTKITYFTRSVSNYDTQFDYSAFYLKVTYSNGMKLNENSPTHQNCDYLLSGVAHDFNVTFYITPSGSIEDVQFLYDTRLCNATLVKDAANP